MLADLIRVDVRMAPLIDAALGDLTQYIVVDGTRLAEQLALGDLALQGRVGIAPIPTATAEALPDPPQLTADRTVLGRADRFVDTDSRYSPLVQQLLGQTWCVESLSDALRLRAMLGEKEARARFVTRAGEVLEADGRLLAGPRQASLGLVSRRSELRALQAEIQELEPAWRQIDQRIGELQTAVSASVEGIAALTEQYDAAAAQLLSDRLASRGAAERVEAFERQLAELLAELQQRETQRQVKSELRRQQSELFAQAQTRTLELDQLCALQQQELAELEQLRQQALDRVTEVKVELARSEQRVDSLRGQLIRFQEDQRERARAVEETQSQMHLAETRQRQSERTILVAHAALAELLLRSEQLELQARQLTHERQRRIEARQLVQRELDELRSGQQQLDERRHALDLEIHRLLLERESLAQRVRDDYGVELAELDELADVAELPQNRDEIDQEIQDLRRRLSNMGAVNMTALEEIDSLEQRHEGLVAQFQDLVAAKESLVRIIHKINADSRRLFTESLEAIRANFQGIFRRVFGGGQADIVLEPGVDLLEAGIDIVATPPGKHSLGISLLSGGERALTAVTLLLAIFQYRPSPFCVLDEVDGPLDEANISRFVDVLNEFLSWTKFVVVTHSKKTMTAAHTLYGVTMQESGVSKRVSVQFEDVSEDGQIRSEAVNRESAASGDPPTGDDQLGAA
jgi:chromosome segregation protein